MKKIKNILFYILLMLFAIPNVANADTGRLYYTYQKLAKLGEETTYTFLYGGSSDMGEYEFFVTYDKEYLELVKTDNGSFYFGACGGEVITINDNNGTITIKHSAKACHGQVVLIFKTLKEGATQLEVTAGANTNFDLGGGPQEINDIKTEIVNTNIECSKCEECVKCEECKENSNVLLYVVSGISLALAIFAVTVMIINIPKKKK